MRKTLNNTWRRRRSGMELLERRVLLAVIYVDDTAPGPARDGSSWATAYTDLQPALDATASTGADEIRVAAGTYRPAARADPADPRSATFSLLNGVSLLGGFSDGGGVVRDPAANAATLSGDIGTPGSAGDNSYHVVLAVGVGVTTVLDGFTITGGNASGGGEPDEPRSWGGGMYSVFNSSPSVANCTFRGNFAIYGGGMFSSLNSSPSLTGCTFRGNSAYGEGGGMYNDGSSPSLTSCTFSGNSAYVGGGMQTYGSSTTVINCILWGNWVREGGLGSEIYDERGTTVRHSLVQGGWAGESNLSADPLFVRNPSPGPDGRWSTPDEPSSDDTTATCGCGRAAPPSTRGTPPRCPPAPPPTSPAARG